MPFDYMETQSQAEKAIAKGQWKIAIILFEQIAAYELSIGQIGLYATSKHFAEVCQKMIYEQYNSKTAFAVPADNSLPPFYRFISQQEGWNKIYLEAGGELVIFMHQGSEQRNQFDNLDKTKELMHQIDSQWFEIVTKNTTTRYVLQDDGDYVVAE